MRCATAICGRPRSRCAQRTRCHAHETSNRNCNRRRHDRNDRGDRGHSVDGRKRRHRVLGRVQPQGNEEVRDGGVCQCAAERLHTGRRLPVPVSSIRWQEGALAGAVRRGPIRCMCAGGHDHDDRGDHSADHAATRWSVRIRRSRGAIARRCRVCESGASDDRKPCRQRRPQLGRRVVVERALSESHGRVRRYHRRDHPMGRVQVGNRRRPRPCAGHRRVVLEPGRDRRLHDRRSGLLTGSLGRQLPAPVHRRSPTRR